MSKLLSELLKGTYNAGTSYTVGDIVDYNGSSYANKVNSTGNLPTNTTYWALLAEKGATGATGSTGATGATGAAGANGSNGADGLDITWLGAYAGGTSYVINDAVSYDGSSYICILASTGNLPTNGTYWNLMASKGATGAGTGDVSKVGTPVNNQVGVWTGDGTLEGDASLTFDTTTDTLAVAASGKIAIGAVNIIDDTAGTTTLSNIDALDETTESTIESAIDTLANLTSIQGRTVTLADAGANAIFGWDDVAGVYENLTQSEVKGVIGTASDTATGVIEVATTAETNTGTDATRAVSPDGLAESYAGTKSISVQVTDGTSDVATGDGKAYITIPEALNGMNLVRAQATVVTAGTTNATTVMIHNKTDAQDMLSGAISIASGGTVGTVGTINGSFDDVATNDVLRIDVDSVSTTAPKGLMVILEFRLP